MVQFVDIVKGQAVSLANQGFKKAMGNLRGVVGSSLNRGQPTNNPALKARLDPKAFTFPLDVTNADQGLGNHGHYILFFINEQKNANIEFGKKQASSRGFHDTLKAASQHGIASEVRTFVDNVAGGGTFQTVTNKLGLDNLVEGLSSSQSFTSAVAGSDEFKRGSVISESDNTALVDRPATTRLDTAIALYMPPTVNVTYTANYTDTEIGAGAAKAAEILTAKSAKEGLGIAFSDETNQEIVDALKKAALGAVGAIPGAQGARELFEMQQGFIMTNRMELAFKGLPKRGFQYTFKMIPKSEQEAEEVRNIVTAFKMNMLPEGMESGDGFTGKNLKIPNTFDIKYMYVGRENEYLNKISTCVLESMNVTYGGDRFKTFDGNEDGAPPMETTITLNFKEMELITKQRAEEGF
tara:strand:+ start:5031 stop:6260 length:1230 start_codon:yes stop_codon:yes gene_type:complete